MPPLWREYQPTTLALGARIETSIAETHKKIYPGSVAVVLGGCPRIGDLL
jgi:hypothetical protein